MGVSVLFASGDQGVLGREGRGTRYHPDYHTLGRTGAHTGPRGGEGRERHFEKYLQFMDGQLAELLTWCAPLADTDDTNPC